MLLSLKTGTIKGMRIDLYSDAGDTYDCTFAVKWIQVC